jgi:hypothetical protein
VIRSVPCGLCSEQDVTVADQDPCERLTALGGAVDGAQAWQSSFEVDTARGQVCPIWAEAEASRIQPDIGPQVPLVDMADPAPIRRP